MINPENGLNHQLQLVVKLCVRWCNHRGVVRKRRATFDFGIVILLISDTILVSREDLGFVPSTKWLLF